MISFVKSVSFSRATLPVKKQKAMAGQAIRLNKDFLKIITKLAGIGTGGKLEVASFALEGTMSH